MEELNATLTNNLAYVVTVIGIVLVVLIGFIISLESRLSNMKKRYRKITMGNDDGASSQEILIKHAEKINTAVDAEEKLTRELNQLKESFAKTISRVAVVRFNAFNDDTAELSYCIALLDAENSGVIISSITGREFSRSYVKLIEKGTPQNHKLTKEEEQALRDAAAK